MRASAWLSGLCMVMIAILGGGCGAGTTDAPPSRRPTVVAPRTTAEARAHFERDLRAHVQHTLTLPVADSTAEAWQKTFWAMGLLGDRAPEDAGAIARVLATMEGQPPAFQRWALEALYGAYPEQEPDALRRFVDTTSVPRLYAMAALHLARADDSPATREHLRTHLRQRFPDWNDDPTLRRLDQDLRASRAQRVAGRPPLDDLLAHSFAPGAAVIVSFQRTDRRYPGRTVLRRPDGTFLREDDGTLFSISHLALAASGLPGYLTNGNTPQGVLSIQGLGHSDNVFIGPSPTLVLALPFEVSVEAFFHGMPPDSVGTWTRGPYADLLPPSWTAYGPIYEAYDAGAAGRTEIIAHGTTIAPAFYADAPFAPNTPSLGCLTAAERWDPATGRRVASDQMRLIEAFRSVGAPSGYFVVVELDGQQRPVAVGDVRSVVVAAERSRAGGRQVPPETS